MNGTYVFGLDVLGAGHPRITVSPRAGFVLKKTPGGKKHVALVLSNPKPNDHLTSIQNARDAGKRAISVGTKIQTKAASAPSVAQTAAAAVRAGQAALKHASKHEHLVKAETARIKMATQAVSKTLTAGRGGKTSVFGVASTILDMYRDALLGDDGADAVNATKSATGIGPAPTVAPPLKPGLDYTPSGPNDDINVYSSDPKTPGVALPLGFVIYDGSRQVPWQGLGSYNHYYGGSGNGFSGYQWGGRDKNAPIDGWYYQSGSDVLPSAGNSMPQRSATSVKTGWGPLIGSPVGDWTKHLHYDAGGDQWFWYRDQAPPWATRANDQARLNQAILDYKAQVATQAADAAAQIAQDQLDKDNAAALAKQQAAEDAATAARYDQELAEAQKAADAKSAQPEAGGVMQDDPDAAPPSDGSDLGD